MRVGKLQQIRTWLRPPRRLRLRRPGGFLLVGSLALGLASLNTGNNLLYLLLGALLGIIALSGWLSEQVLRAVSVRRIPPRPVHAGATARIEYVLHARQGRLPGHGLTVREQEPVHAAGQGAVDTAAAAPEFGAAFVATLPAGGSAGAAADVRTVRRGIFPLQGVVLATAFPFGLFEKERDIDTGGVLTVWPRTDRAVRQPRAGGQRGVRQQAGTAVAVGAARGDYRGLREYRPGDDPRDIHWRSTARRGEPILRQYDRDASSEYWIVLDTAAPTTDAAEAAVEMAASLYAAAVTRGDRVGLAAGAVRLEPGSAHARLESALDVLAAVAMTPHGGAPVPPADAHACVLVTARSAAGEWGDIILAGAGDAS